jgi:hypothetical protein
MEILTWIKRDPGEGRVQIVKDTRALDVSYIPPASYCKLNCFINIFLVNGVFINHR